MVNKKNKGSLLVISLFTMLMILIIGLSLAASSVKNKRSSIGSGRSLQSLQLAEDGVENALSAIKSSVTVTEASGKIGVCDPPSGKIKNPNYLIEFRDNNNLLINCSITDPVSRIVHIKSIGSPVNGQVRAIEAVVPYGGILCGEGVLYEGVSYETVKIGTQCWMKKNLNVGEKIEKNISPTNNGKIERYCYDNDSSNCDKYGGLYKWEEAMQYDGTKKQGICPAGWHIPSDSEWFALEDFLRKTTESCDPTRKGKTTGWGCNNAGERMKSGGDSGLNVLIGGAYYSWGAGATYDGGFWGKEGDLTNNSSFYTHIWSSANSKNEAFWRFLSETPSWGWANYKVHRDNVMERNLIETLGSSVRCIKN